jgi:glycerol kinase
MGFIKHSSKITELAETVKDNGGVVFVTAFSGLFAPYWIDDAKGTLCKFIFEIPFFRNSKLKRSQLVLQHTLNEAILHVQH